jgi:Ubiquitin-like modifier-activating enzyme ATG7 N-terminus
MEGDTLQTLLFQPFQVGLEVPLPRRSPTVPEGNACCLLPLGPAISFIHLLASLRVQSSVDVTFWAELNDLKLDRLRLSEEPLALTGASLTKVLFFA